MSLSSPLAGYILFIYIIVGRSRRAPSVFPHAGLVFIIFCVFSKEKCQPEISVLTLVVFVWLAVSPPPHCVFREAIFQRTVTTILAIYIMRVAEVHTGLPWSGRAPDIG